METTDKIKTSNYIINTLVEMGITHIFEVCGGSISHLLDSLYDRKDITTVSMHHEQAAAFAAEGYARAGGDFGVAMATSGPGATNLITGIGSCYFDSIPCMFITGQVNTYEYNHNHTIRQKGFQETDIVSIVSPIVKKAVLVKNADHIPCVIQSLYNTMLYGRRGPVLLDIPLDIQRTDININNDKPEIISVPIKTNLTTIEHIYDLISNSKRPIILAGGGVRADGACEELHKFVYKTGVPIVSSLMGKDAFMNTSQMYMGMIGTYGNRYANLAIQNADLVIVLGSRLDTRQTGTLPKTFARDALIIRVDIDKMEIDEWDSELIINAGIKQFLRDMLEYPSTHIPHIATWLSILNNFKLKYPDFNRPSTNETNIDPNYLMRTLSDYIPDDAIICVDVGQHQMWAAQSLKLTPDQRFLTQGGMAAIGSALPMAIGASFACPGKMVVVIVGDGGFQLNIQELQTIYHHNLPIKIIMLNNNGYGMIKQFQEQYFNSRFQSSGIGYSNPNFKDVVSAYKINTTDITSIKNVEQVFTKIFRNNDPEFIEVEIPAFSKVTPKLSVNKPLEDQEPLLSREELKSNIITGEII